MGCAWKMAEDGKKFVLTDKGKENNRVAYKFGENYSHHTQYEQSVPVNWIRDGYVMEVDNDEGT